MQRVSSLLFFQSPSRRAYATSASRSSGEFLQLTIHSAIVNVGVDTSITSKAGGMDGDLGKLRDPPHGFHRTVDWIPNQTVTERNCKHAATAALATK